MRNLKNLELLDFPSEHISKSLPQSLRELCLAPYDWRQDLPRGLKDLRNLEEFQFQSARKSWDITRPLGEFLPIHSLKCLKLGAKTFSKEEIRDVASKQHIHCAN